MRAARLDARDRFAAVLTAMSEELSAATDEVAVLTPARAVVWMTGPNAVRALEDDLTDVAVRLLRSTGPPRPR